MPNGMYGGVRGWGREAPAYSIAGKFVLRPVERAFCEVIESPSLMVLPERVLSDTRRLKRVDKQSRQE